ncbi:MAG TPA: hypothetical protein VMJ75_10610 [Candidatus Acidoferrales bacterium]|nr:hypothetical protein [Candidatus Acidoferrales bacterium]HXK04054.1 hypothetical protein [Verrucomicrobiae bacterium]
MRKSNVALRLQPSLLEEARKVAQSEGIALNQLINVAVAEKLSVLRTDEYFRQRAAGANIARALKILSRTGTGNPPMPGDELAPQKARPVRRRSGS